MANIDINSVNEPQSSWGGDWTEKKLDAFAKYVSAYLTIMNKNKYWETIYFDGFAGSGDRKKNCDTNLYKQLFIDKIEEDSYKGAAERVLTLPNKLHFDYYYFIDTNQNSLDRLKAKIDNLSECNSGIIQFKQGDCNTFLEELANAMNKKPKSYASLVLLDPFGMQINWSSIAKLAGTKTDVWILVPTGVIVNRLLDKNGDLKHTVKLQSFFGLDEEEIRKYFYTKETVNTLFGEQELIQKIKKPIGKIAELYIKQLKTIWKHVTDRPLVLTNKKGVPIFHFVFASNYNVAVNIAKQIIIKS
jgi:three-Cys-motif partner protein